jgi:hypothetical protein
MFSSKNSSTMRYVVVVVPSVHLKRGLANLSLFSKKGMEDSMDRSEQLEIEK